MMEFIQILKNKVLIFVESEKREQVIRRILEDKADDIKYIQKKLQGINRRIDGKSAD